MEEAEVVLTVNGNRHDGWKQVTVRSSIEELAHSFSVDYSRRWTAAGEPIGITAGDGVEIRIAETLVLTGYVDETSEDYDAGSHSVSAIGRSRTGDLCDCAAIYQGGAVKGQDLRQVAETLCKPFGIKVSLSPGDLDIGDPSNVQIEDGATVFEVLSNIARTQGLLLLTDTAGNLVLSRAASEPKLSLELRLGENIKRGSLRCSARGRFSSYTLKGQAPTSGASATSLKFQIADDDVKRYRPTVLLDHQATMQRLKQRAIWERNTAAGKALNLTYDVQGWTNIYGLWQPNTLLHLIDPTFGLDAFLLVSAVDLQRSLDGGRTARLELCARETFDVLKPPKPPRRKGKKDKLAALLGGR
jgi:prophage tail gpP-like protein